VIVTGRSGLHGFAGAQVVELDPPSGDECLGLLARIVGRARLENERQAAERIVGLCGRLPLAVRCAGSRLAAYQGMSLRSFADRLADPRTRLDDLTVANFDVRAALASADVRLGASERSVLRLLSLLRTPYITAPQAAALLGCPIDRAERLLARLAECSLLRVEHGKVGEVCYALHDLVRLYARERLEDELDTYLDGAFEENASVRSMPGVSPPRNDMPAEHNGGRADQPALPEFSPVEPVHQVNRAVVRLLRPGASWSGTSPSPGGATP
jgi:hypothetical protein